MVEAVTMAAGAVKRPRAVTTSTAVRRPHSIAVTGALSCTGSPAASLASSVPKPCRQKASTSLSEEREKSSAEISDKSLPQPNGPRKNSIVELPLAEVLRQRLRARHIALARSIVRWRCGAHLRRQKIFHLAFARETPADADASGRAVPDRCRDRSASQAWPPD